MGVGDTFLFYDYVSDDTTTYTVKMTSAVATAGGFTLQSDPLSQPFYPYGTKNMRHVWGKDGSGHRTRLPCAEPDNAKFVGGGTFTIGARTYGVEGAVGEKRALNNLGG